MEHKQITITYEEFLKLIKGIVPPPKITGAGVIYKKDGSISYPEKENK